MLGSMHDSCREYHVDHWWNCHVAVVADACDVWHLDYSFDDRGDGYGDSVVGAAVADAAVVEIVGMDDHSCWTVWESMEQSWLEWMTRRKHHCHLRHSHECSTVANPSYSVALIFAWHAPHTVASQQLAISSISRP